MFNKTQIMKAAWQEWHRYNARKDWAASRDVPMPTFGECLKLAWGWAKHRMAREAEKLAATSFTDLTARRSALQAEITRLEYSDALGTAAKLQAARSQLNSLPLAA